MCEFVIKRQPHQRRLFREFDNRELVDQMKFVANPAKIDKFLSSIGRFTRPESIDSVAENDVFNFFPKLPQAYSSLRFIKESVDPLQVSLPVSNVVSGRIHS